MATHNEDQWLGRVSKNGIEIVSIVIVHRDELLQPHRCTPIRLPLVLLNFARSVFWFPTTQVSEGDQQGNYVALLGNILFPLLAFGGLFFLFGRGQNGQSGGGPFGGMGGGPMDFGKSKSKFQEVPDTGVTFDDVAVSGQIHFLCLCMLMTVTHHLSLQVW